MSIGVIETLDRITNNLAPSLNHLTTAAKLAGFLLDTFNSVCSVNSYLFVRNTRILRLFWQQVSRDSSFLDRAIRSDVIRSDPTPLVLTLLASNFLGPNEEANKRSGRFDRFEP